MKTIKTVLLIVAITFSSVLSANTNPNDAEPTTMNKVIGKLLQAPNFKVDQDVIALVTLTINQDNEIVVLHVDSKSATLRSFIKGRLNYKEITTDLVSKSKTYVVPVRITQD